MSCGCWWRFLSSCVQLCRNTILPAERADMCNRTCSVKRSVTRQGHDTRDKEGRSELAGKPIEGVQSSSCRAALSFFFKTSVWAAGAPFPSSLACSPVLQVSCPDLAYPAACLQCGIVLCSQALSRCWLLIFLHLCCSRLALYGQLRLGRSPVASRWQSRVSTAALLRPSHPSYS